MPAALGLPTGTVAVHLLEDNAGGLIVLSDGFVWAVPADPHRPVAGDRAEMYGRPLAASAQRWHDDPIGVVYGPWHRVDARQLAAQVHPCARYCASSSHSHDATRHVATWTPEVTIPADGPRPAAVTVVGRPGAAAAAWLGDDAPTEA